MRHRSSALIAFAAAGSLFASDVLAQKAGQAPGMRITTPQFSPPQTAPSMKALGPKSGGVVSGEVFVKLPGRSTGTKSKSGNFSGRGIDIPTIDGVPVNP
jgi:hypothetical protein